MSTCHATNYRTFELRWKLLELEHRSYHSCMAWEVNVFNAFASQLFTSPAAPIIPSAVRCQRMFDIINTHLPDTYLLSGRTNFFVDFFCVALLSGNWILPSIGYYEVLWPNKLWALSDEVGDAQFDRDGLFIKICNNIVRKVCRNNTCSYLPLIICNRCDINIIVLFVSTQVPLYIANKHYGRRIPLVFVVFTSTLQFPNVLYLSDALLSFVDGFPL